MKSKTQNKQRRQQNPNPWVHRIDCCLPEREGISNGETGEGDQELQASSYKIIKS